MKVKILGCSGGIGGELRTTSFLVMRVKERRPQMLQNHQVFEF